MNVSADLNSVITGPCFWRSGGPIFFSLAKICPGFKIMLDFLFRTWSIIQEVLNVRPLHCLEDR